LFVPRHPLTTAYAYGASRSVDELVRAVNDERGRFNVSFVLLKTDAEIRRQRLVTRLYHLADNAVERDVRCRLLHEHNEAKQAEFAANFEVDMINGGVFDAVVDSTSVKQCSARLLSLLAIGKSAFE